jgi:hypothetical protein
MREPEIPIGNSGLFWYCGMCCRRRCMAGKFKLGTAGNRNSAW